MFLLSRRTFKMQDSFFTCNWNGTLHNIYFWFAIQNNLIHNLCNLLIQQLDGITFTGTVSTSTFSIIDTNLGMYVLGFRNISDTLASSIYTASSSNYNLNFDNYINMRLTCIFHHWTVWTLALQDWSPLRRIWRGIYRTTIEGGSVSKDRKRYFE